MSLDVLIAGGGPAGASAAIALASAGARVALVDRARFPRHRIGESLPPKVGPILALLGVEEAVARAQFLRMRGTTLRQGGVTESHAFDPGGAALGYQVERARFDLLLLDRARALGVEVREGTSVVGIARGEGVTGARVLGSGGAPELLSARFVLDATGTRAALARALGERRRESLRTVALSGYWRGARIPADIAASDTLFETFPDGWMWSVLRSDGLRNVTFALDARALRGAPKRARYLERIARASLVAPLLAGATLEGEIAAHDATWADSRAVIGPGWLLAGDAASFIDPLTSQGVYKALQSGLAAAAVIRTILWAPARAALASEYYQSSQDEFHRNYVRTALDFYGSSPFAAEPFWRDRSARAPFAPGPFDALSAASRAERRARWSERVAGTGGALRVARSPALELASTGAVERGWVVEERRFAAHGAPIPTAPGASRVRAELLFPLLDGRSLSEVFEGYARASGAPSSSDLGRALLNALLALAELELLLEIG